MKIHSLARRAGITQAAIVVLGSLLQRVPSVGSGPDTFYSGPITAQAVDVELDVVQAQSNRLSWHGVPSRVGSGCSEVPPDAVAIPIVGCHR